MNIKPNWPAPKNIKAFTTTRDAWGELYNNKFDIDKLMQIYQLPNFPTWLDEIHGIDVIEATPQNAGQKADASYSKTKKNICMVTTADCLPILICDKSGTHVAAIHAGWRGLAAGVIENTIKKLNVPAQDLYVWLGPAIGPKHFEVGTDVYHAFVAKNAEAQSAFKQQNSNKWLANLYQLATQRLQQFEISNIYGGEFCTYSQTDLFYSYRREKTTGRMASLIWIDE